VEKKQYDLFLEVFRRFQKAGLLDDIVLIGSWTTVFYKAYFKGFQRLKKYALVTRTSLIFSVKVVFLYRFHKETYVSI